MKVSQDSSVKNMFYYGSRRITEEVAPFWRQIQPEEVWLYRYPNSAGYVTTKMLYVCLFNQEINLYTN